MDEANCRVLAEWTQEEAISKVREQMWEKTLQRALEADGTQLLEIPGEAHDQAGIVEFHGRYFEDLLLRVLAQIRLETKTEWMECVAQTMEAQNSFMRKCGCSPFHCDWQGPGGAGLFAPGFS